MILFHSSFTQYIEGNIDQIPFKQARIRKNKKKKEEEDSEGDDSDDHEEDELKTNKKKRTTKFHIYFKVLYCCLANCA